MIKMACGFRLQRRSFITRLRLKLDRSLDYPLTQKSDALGSRRQSARQTLRSPATPAAPGARYSPGARGKAQPRRRCFPAGTVATGARPSSSLRRRLLDCDAGSLKVRSVSQRLVYQTMCGIYSLARGGSSGISPSPGVMRAHELEWAKSCGTAAFPGI